MIDARAIAWPPHEVAACFFEETRPLNSLQRDWLIDRGVPECAIAHDPGRDTAEIRVARVRFEGRFFEFARAEDEQGRPAFAVIARNEFEECDDIVAFDARGNIAPWLGRAALLGAQMQHHPRIESAALPVFPDALAWLRAKRRGVVILDPSRARWRLAQEEILIDDPAFERRLHSQLRLPSPRILVAKPSRRAA